MADRNTDNGNTASPMMAQVHAEVAQLWGQAATPAYSRARIRHWLDNYLDTFDTDAAETSLYIATIKADVWRAAQQSSPQCRLFFRLFCESGLNFQQIRRVTGWGISTCQRRWRELVEVCCESLCGDVEEVRRAVGCRVLPRSYAVSFEGKFPIQVGGKVERR